MKEVFKKKKEENKVQLKLVSVFKFCIINYFKNFNVIILYILLSIKNN